MVAWLSCGQCQEETKQGSKISLLRDNGSYANPPMLWKHAGIRGNEIADGLARGGTPQRFLGPVPALGVSRRDLKKRLS